MQFKNTVIYRTFRNLIIRGYVFVMYSILGILQKKKVNVFCMNLGLFKKEEEQTELKPEHQVERLQFQLYHHLVKDLELSQKDILEIGSGIGGGCLYFKTYFKPKSVTGIDLIRQNVAISRSRYSKLGMNFICDDACSFSYPLSSIDIIVNLESSHSYGDFSMFLKKVYETLRPGGYFTFGDIRFVKDYSKLKSAFLDSGFTIVKEENITGNVCKSLVLDKERKIEVLGKRSFIKLLFSNLGFLEGGKNYNFLMNGETQYYHFLLMKPNQIQEFL